MPFNGFCMYKNKIIYRDSSIIKFDASTKKHKNLIVTISSCDEEVVFKQNLRWVGLQKKDYKNIYIVNSYNLRIHRLIMNAKKGDHVDHIDTNTLNNTRKNLRFCTNNQNQLNKSLSKKNSSGFKGVYFNKVSQKWLAQIRINGIKKSIGYFEDKIEAAKEYDKYAIKYHKEFARTNKDMGLY